MISLFFHLISHVHFPHANTLITSHRSQHILKCEANKTKKERRSQKAKREAVHHFLFCTYTERERQYVSPMAVVWNVYTKHE